MGIPQAAARLPGRRSDAGQLPEAQRAASPSATRRPPRSSPARGEQVGIVRAIVLLWLLRQALRLARILIMAAVLVMRWPVTAAALLAADMAGRPPAGRP